MKDVYILGIESSCDETSMSIVKNGSEEIATIVLSQIDIHKKYGGTIPEIASREHFQNYYILLEEIKKVINAEDDVYYEGANKVFELPEFKDFEMAKNFINVLDEKDTMIGKLNESIDDDIHIYIGDEEDNELKDFSIITFNNKVHGKSVGTIGIIGPKRMDYAKVIAALKYINRRMNQGGLLTSGDEKQN